MFEELKSPDLTTEKLLEIRKLIEIELNKHSVNSIRCKALFECKELGINKKKECLNYEAFIFKPIILFYDEDLLQLSLFVNLLENCKALWMRINVGDYGATEYHASETGLITLLGALQKMKNLKTLYIYFRFENYNWEWKSRQKIVSGLKEEYYKKLNHLDLFRIEFSYNI